MFIHHRRVTVVHTKKQQKLYDSREKKNQMNICTLIESRGLQIEDDGFLE